MRRLRLPAPVLALTPLIALALAPGCLDGAASPDTSVTPPDTTTDTATPDLSSPDVAEPDASPSDSADPIDTPEVEPPDTSTPDTIPPDTSPSDVMDTIEPQPTRSLELGSWTMRPGEETTRCVIKRLGNPERLLIDRITTSLARGSHHFIVYKSSETVEQPTPFPCTPFSDTLGGSTVPIMITQIREETLTLPEGVAFELAPNQMIRLEAHFLNYFPDDIETGATVTFGAAPPSTTTLADFMFYGTTQVFIPAGQSVTTAWKYHPVPSGLQVFGLTGHTHALGTNVEIQKSTGRTTAGTPVYPPEGQPFRWDEAPLAHFSPPLAFTNDGFRFRCSWTNTTNQNVSFGESANQEMCFFWAYYYPSQGFILRF